MLGVVSLAVCVLIVHVEISIELDSRSTFGAIIIQTKDDFRQCMVYVTVLDFLCYTCWQCHIFIYFFELVG